MKLRKKSERTRTAGGWFAAALLAVLLAVSACSGQGVRSLNRISLAELEQKAKKEQYLYSIAMPDTWANWEETWEDLADRYGIFQYDIDMSSAEELEVFRAQKEEASRDIGDVGRSYAVQAEKERLLLKYKTGHWEDIPDWAKDDDGDWIVCYTGNVSFLANMAQVKRLPHSWREVRDAKFAVTVGDVVSSIQAQYAVIASAYAFGGDIENLRPGIDFWKELAAEGRLEPVYTKLDRIKSGETQFAVLMDFNSLNYRKQAQEENPELDLQVAIPSDGSVTLGYSVILSRYARHPHAAALAREYILSDEGQINLARGFAKPIRDVELPPEVKAQLIPEDQYEDVIVLTDEETVQKALDEVVKAWEDEVLPLLG